MKKKKRYLLLSEAQEKYLQFYHEYYCLNWTWFEIAKYHKCSRSSVQQGLNWVDKNKLQIPAKDLLTGAITSVKIRLKRNKELYDKEYNKKRKRNNKLLLELNKELREDEKLLFKLQDVLTERYDIDVKMSSAKILQMIREEASKKKPNKNLK